MIITDEDDHHDSGGDSVDYVTCGHLECICGDAISGYQTLVLRSSRQQISTPNSAHLLLFITNV